MKNWLAHHRSVHRGFFYPGCVNLLLHLVVWTTIFFHASRLSRNPDHTVTLNCLLHDYPQHQLLHHLQIKYVMILCFQMKMLNDMRSKIYHPGMSQKIHVLSIVTSILTLSLFGPCYTYVNIILESKYLLLYKSFISTPFLRY